MEYISVDQFWRFEFYNNVSAKDRTQDINLNLIKFEVNDTYQENEEMSTIFEPNDNDEVINKGYIDTK